MNGAGDTLRCVIIGGGGHAAVVIDAMLVSGAATPLAIVDADPGQHGRDVLGIPIVGGDGELDRLAGDGANAFVVGLGTIGAPAPRQALFELGLAKNLQPVSVIHPRAAVAPSVAIGAGSVVFAQAAVNPLATVGRNAIVNTGAIVEHHCRLGDGVHVATGAAMGGDVSIGDGAHVGAGAVIRQGVSVGAGAVIGAGAVVVADVAAGATVVGNPARPQQPEARS